MRHRRGGGNVGALFVCQSDNVAPYWVTHPFARRMTAWNRFVVRISEYLGKSRQHTVCKTSQHPVGEAADRILFVDDQGPVEQARHHAAGEGGIAAHAEHDIGAALEDGDEALPESDQQGGRQQQLFQQALATHATHADPHHVDARRRDYARFQPGTRTKPEYLPAARAPDPSQTARATRCGRAWSRTTTTTAPAARPCRAARVAWASPAAAAAVPAR